MFAFAVLSAGIVKPTCFHRSENKKRRDEVILEFSTKVFTDFRSRCLHSVLTRTYTYAIAPQWGTADAEIKNPSVEKEPRAQRFSL